MNRYAANLITVAIILTIVVFFAGCAKNCETAEVTQPAKFSVNEHKPVVATEQSLEDKWGIKIESTRLSAGGYMIDFRYRVLDAGKALPLFDRNIKPYLIDQASGAKFIVPNPPKVGQLRNVRDAREGKIYFIFFANPGRYVKTENKVTIVIGDCRIENIVVQ